MDALCTALISLGLLTSSGYNPLLALLVYLVMSLTDATWQRLTDPMSDFQLVVGVSVALTMATYCLHGGAYLLLDISHRPAWLYQYKLQPTKPFPLSSLPRVTSTLLFGFSLLVPYSCVIYYAGVVRVERGALPSAPQMGLELLVIVLTTELAFFTSHWVLHRKSIYPYIHKVHHEFTSPVALVAAYAHPVEFFVGNILSVTLGAWVYHPHLFTWLVWLTFGTIGTQVHHCGYRFPWHLKIDHEPDFHDLHHEAFTSNYGLLGIMDYICGTDKKYREHKKKKL